MTDEHREIIRKINKEIEDGTMLLFGSIYGDTENHLGVVEDIFQDGKWQRGGKHIVPSPFGSYVKIYGCSFMWEGIAEKEVVEGLSLAKSFISVFPRELLLKSPFLMLYVASLFLFRRKRFYRNLKLIASQVYARTFAKPECKFRYINQNILTRELKRALEVAVLKRLHDKGVTNFTFDKISPDAHYIYDTALNTPLDFYGAVIQLAEFLYFFIESDGRYRLVFQDAFSHLNKDNERKNPVKELRRLLKIMQGRETTIHQRKKVEAIIKATSLLYFWKDAREILREFFNQVKVSILIPDEADQYFMLERKDYNYFGELFHVRAKRRESIDLEKGHLRFKLERRSPKK